MALPHPPIEPDDPESHAGRGGTGRAITPAEPVRSASSLRRVGYFTHVKGADARRTLRETIEQAVAAEEAGLDVFWVAQHHVGAAASCLPSPLVLLAAVAARTERIELGVSTVVAAAEHPLRLAEDAAVLDELSNGRLRVTFGTGVEPRTAEVFSLGEDNRARALAVIDTVLAAWSGGIDGFCPLPQALARRAALASNSGRAVDAAAARGLGVMIGRAPAGPRGPGPGDVELAGVIDRYRQATGAAAHVAVSRPVICAADAATATQILLADADRWLRIGRETGRWDDRYTAADHLAAGNVYHGAPAAVADALRVDPGLQRADELVCHTVPTIPDQTATLTSIRLLGHELAPLLRDDTRS